MKCHDVKNILSEYIDGILEEDRASLIKEHLNLCADCKEEYEDLTKIIGRMNQMESLEVPESFQENVKSRLERSFSLKRLIKRFFFPVHIKLPFELAGAMLVIILVVFLVGIREDRHLYDLTFSVKARTILEIPEKKQDLEKEEKMESRLKKGEKKGRGVSIDTEKDKGKRREEPKEGEKKEASLQEIINALGGKIIKSDYQKEKGILNTLVIEIPADKYQALLQRLEGLGGIQKPYPVIKERGQEIVKIRMTIQNFD